MLLNQNGQPYRSQELQQAQQSVARLQRQILYSRYDAAQTTNNNVEHWANADNLAPNSVNTLEVRRKLRSRSRYEVIENNPYLKGTVLTLANDFVGTGPKLQIVDPRFSEEQRKLIERRWIAWSKATKLRKKLWSLRMAKLVDGEGFLFAYNDESNLEKGQPSLNFQIIETDQISSQNSFGHHTSLSQVNEVDGIVFDSHNNPLRYYKLDVHPGTTNQLFSSLVIFNEGQWVPAKFVIQWFRQDRQWLRGIPELTPSLPLCALLRRYTLAVVRQQELSASFAAILETEGPPSMTAWTDGSGNIVNDDPFDSFPIEHGMFTTMPWGYKMNQLDAIPNGNSYDDFVGSLLREITRPILVPYNMSSGSSKDANMSSAVVDTHIYRQGQLAERTSCEEDVLDKIFWLWFQEGLTMPGYFNSVSGDLALDIRMDAPVHLYRWDPVGLEHTDPTKVAGALATMRENGFITDRDIQETRYNRSVEEWREEIREDQDFRKELGLDSAAGITQEAPQTSPEDEQEETPQE